MSWYVHFLVWNADLFDFCFVTNYIRHYSAHDHQRHVTRIPEESRAPRSDHRTLYRLSPPPPPIVNLPHMLHASVPLANPQTARTSRCALTLRMRSHALACMLVLPPFPIGNDHDLVPALEAAAFPCTLGHKPKMHASSRRTSPLTLILRGTLQDHVPPLALPTAP